jgi:hypothetical protein
MAFSPSVYGDRAAAMLNVVAEVYQWRDEYKDDGCPPRFFTRTQPEGTPFEADICTSCNPVRFNAVNMILQRMSPDDDLYDDENEYASHFFADPAEYTAMCEEYKKTDDPAAQTAISTKIKETIISSMLEFRKTIREAVKPEEEETLAFSDSLYGPHLAKVMNCLLVVEIQLTENDLTTARLRHPDSGGEHQQVFQSLMLKNSLLDQRRSFALRSGKGTAFAGDLLVLQHLRSRGFELKDGKGKMLPLIKGALFPEFRYNFKGNRSHRSFAVNLLCNAKTEAAFILDIVHGQALPILMAGIHRLGHESLFRDMDRELMCMIAHLVIFGEMPK